MNTIQYRPFTRLHEMKFREDLRAAAWSMIEAFDDPTDPLALWYAMFDSIVDRHAPLLSKRVKSLQLPPCILTDILFTIRKETYFKQKQRILLFLGNRTNPSEISVLHTIGSLKVATLHNRYCPAKMIPRNCGKY